MRKLIFLLLASLLSGESTDPIGVTNVTLKGFANIQNFSEYEVLISALSGENNGWISVYNNTFNGSSNQFLYIKNSSNVNVTDNSFVKSGFVLSPTFADGPLVYIVTDSRNVTIKNNF